MKKKRFSVEQIVAVLEQAELGVPECPLVRHAGRSKTTDRGMAAGIQRGFILPHLAMWLRMALRLFGVKYCGLARSRVYPQF